MAADADEKEVEKENPESEDEEKIESETDEEVFAPSENKSNELNGEEDLHNFFSDLLEMMRIDDPYYTVYSRHKIHINHAIDLGDLLIATILALILIHMFMRDYIKR